jgi:hypothetical protein
VRDDSSGIAADRIVMILTGGADGEPHLVDGLLSRKRFLEPGRVCNFSRIGDVDRTLSSPSSILGASTLPESRLLEPLIIPVGGGSV